MNVSAKYWLWLGLLLTAGVSQAGRFEEGAGAFYTKDYRAAFAHWMPLAENGDATCQVLIGSMYAFGQGVEKNDEAAASWFRRAAEQGSGQGQFNLAVMYENGWGVEKDIDTAIFWFAKAARQDRDDARRKYRELERQKYLASREQPGTPAEGSQAATTVTATIDEQAAAPVAIGTTDRDEPPRPPQVIAVESTPEKSTSTDVTHAVPIKRRPPSNIEAPPAAKDDTTPDADKSVVTAEDTRPAPVSSLTDERAVETGPPANDPDTGSAEQYSSFPNPFEFIGLLLGDALGGATAGSDRDAGFDDDMALEENRPRKDFSARSAAHGNAPAPTQDADSLGRDGITRTPDGRVQMIVPPAGAAE
jgi:hypothetical protein